jgi:glycerol kinase
MSRYIAAIDQGTTSTRCMLFDRQGQAAAAHQIEHRQIFPQPGWVEHDPMEIWQRVQQVVAGALQSAQVGSDDIAAVGIANQRETTLVWNRQTGQPYYNALVWQDTRTDALCAQLGQAGGQDRFRAQTGLPLATYFSGPKIRWLLDNVDGLRADAERGDALFGTVDSWLVWQLTGGMHVTDVTNASRTLLMDLQRLDWDDEILAALDIPRRMLPNIVPSSATVPYGHTLTSGPFGAALPVCGLLGDQQAATVGQACFAPGEAKNTYGTGCFMLLNTGEEIVHSQHGLLTTPCYKLGDAPAVYALEGSIAITGALVQWLRDNLGLIGSAPDIEPLARTVSDNGGMYFVPAFSGLYAPHWRDDARGVIAGLTGYVNKGHFARAALEATAFQTREVLDAMRADAGVDLQHLKVDGGMVANELLMQFQADVLDVPVIRPRVAETTALGAAYAAGLSVGFWSDVEELRANWVADQRWEPCAEPGARAALFAQWKKAVARSLDWVEG